MESRMPISPARQSRNDAPRLPSDYWVIALDDGLAVRSARGIEAEGFDCVAAARHWIEEREAEEADELAAIADSEADLIGGLPDAVTELHAHRLAESHAERAAILADLGTAADRRRR